MSDPLVKADNIRNLRTACEINQNLINNKRDTMWLLLLILETDYTPSVEL